MVADLKISRRAEFIRTIMLEIERLHSHLLWLGVAGHLIGFDTVFMQSWRIREDIMWLCEKWTGNRKTYGMIVVGGVRRDITPEIKDDMLRVLKKVEDECIVVHKAIIGDTTIHKRTKGVGYMTHEEAVQWSLVGPPARARGVDIDVRRDHPYAAYDAVKFDVPVVDTNDVWGTVVVRILRDSKRQDHPSGARPAARRRDPYRNGRCDRSLQTRNIQCRGAQGRIGSLPDLRRGKQGRPVEGPRPNLSEPPGSSDHAP